MRHSPHRAGGWTLLELVIVLGIVAALGAIAWPVYGWYTERASLVQLLVQVDQISTAVQIEDATGVRALQRDSVPGKAPPGLRTVPDASFTEPGGLRLLLIRAPAGFFATSPREERYGLVADLTGAATPHRLHALAAVLPFEAGDKVWLGAGQLAFPLVQRPSAEQPTAPPAPDTSWQASASVNPSGSWDCRATVTAYGTDDRPLTGVEAGIRVHITLEVTTWDGTPITRGWDDLGRLDGGSATFTARNLSAGRGGETVTGCRMQVTGVDYWWPQEPAVRWDGQLAAVHLAMPAGAGCKPPCKP